jgi:pimeloyl-ACP methyl ester carboxylesterase
MKHKCPEAIGPLVPPADKSHPQRHVGGSLLRSQPMERSTRPRRRVAWLGIGLLVALATACGSSDTGSSATTGATPSSLPAPRPSLPPPTPITWSPCPDGSTLRCATVSVPVDYQHPADGSIPLALTQSPALDGTDPRGTLLFNPGGPGESGNQILPVVLGLLPPEVRQQYNIVGFDPRGTGASEPLQCGTAPSAVTSVLPVPARPGRPLPGTPTFTTMARSCAKQTSYEPFVSTINTARDMDRIRQALGLTSVSFYGMSYGTVLGAAYADLFPRHVAMMVLDGAVDVNAPLTRQAIQQAPTAERSLTHLFADCVASSCPLGPDPESFYRSLTTSLSTHPLPAPGNGDTHPVTVGDLDTATLFALSVPAATPGYYAALIAAGHGDGAPLRTQALAFATDVNGAPLVDPQWAIACNDAAAHPSPTTAGNLARSLAARTPLIGAYAVTYNMGGCVSWPQAREPVVDLHPKGTPPILVIGNTGDPNTPLVGARHLAAIFPKASELTWQGWGHTWLLSGSSDTCMQQRITTYLSGGGLPPAGTVCS